MNVSKLIDWYHQHKRRLPWRETSDPYKIWLSEIILQQTQVTQGLPYYEKFIQKYPDIFHLATASEQEILNLWQGLGYYSRARNLHYTAKELVNKHHGNFPDNYTDLLKLKGVGEYTAAAIASFCYDEPKAVLDGNVYRVLSRVFGIDTPINTTEGKKIFKKLAQEHLYFKDPATYNQAIMEFGALHCTPAAPKCAGCPLSVECVAYQTGKVKELPVKLKKNKVKKRYLHYFIIKSYKALIIQKREGKGIWQNLYQLPLIETAKPEMPSDQQIEKLALMHNIELPVKAKLLAQKKHLLTHQHLEIFFWKISLPKKTPQMISFAALKDYPMPIVIANFLDNNIL